MREKGTKTMDAAITTGTTMPSSRNNPSRRNRTKRSKSHSLRANMICCDPMLEEELVWGLNDVKRSIKKTLKSSANDLDRVLGTVFDVDDSHKRKKSVRSKNKIAAQPCTPNKQTQLTTSKNTKTALPEGVLSDDIFVDVQVAQEYESDLNHLVKSVKDNITTELRKIYTADQENSFFTLNVLITRVSDGSISGMTLEGKFDLIGTAILGVAWSLHKSDEYFQWKRNPKSLPVYPKIYNGGCIVLREDLNFSELFDPFHNLGEQYVVEKFTPNCAYDIVSEIVRGRHLTSRGRSRERKYGLVKRMFSMPVLRSRKQKLIKGQ